MICGSFVEVVLGFFKLYITFLISFLQEFPSRHDCNSSFLATAACKCRFKHKYPLYESTAFKSNVLSFCMSGFQRCYED